MTVSEFHALRKQAMDLGLTVKSGTNSEALRAMIAKEEAHIRASTIWEETNTAATAVAEQNIEIPPEIKRAFRIARREAPNAVRRIERWLKEVLCRT